MYFALKDFQFEGLSKRSHREDWYPIRLYQIDKVEHPKNYEYYVQLTSNNSEVYFTWCFNNLADAMEHFKWLENTKVEGRRILFGIESRYDCRIAWRKYAWNAEPLDSYINYWIEKEEYGYWR